MITRDDFERHSVDMRQFIGFRASTLPNGMRIIDAYSISGLHFTILPDRGFDIWLAHYKGIPLTWISQGSPHHPDFGQSWLRQFNGGLMVTAGLMHVGQEEMDTDTDEYRRMHGRYSSLRASNEIGYSAGWLNDYYTCSVQATVTESKLFHEQLELRRTYTIRHDQPIIRVEDTVTNKGDESVPFMLLYHCNFGFPLVREGTHFASPNHAIYPRDQQAKKGYKHWHRYDAPTPRYDEQAFFHHLKAKNDGKNRTTVMLAREDFGIALHWDVDHLPYFTQWKNTRSKIYVCGLEPGNCIPEGQNAAHARERLRMLNPGEQQHFQLNLEVLDGVGKVQECAAHIEDLEANGKPVAEVQLSDYEP
jgi:galactose mutarotase-like enzyme